MLMYGNWLCCNFSNEEMTPSACLIKRCLMWDKTRFLFDNVHSWSVDNKCDFDIDISSFVYFTSD